MASMDGWLKNQAKGLRSFAGSPGANAYNNVQVAQASGFSGADNFLRQAGAGNSVGGSTIAVPPPPRVSDMVPAVPPYDPSEAIGGSKLDRRGPNFGVPPAPGPQSLADAPIQIAQAPTGSLQPADPAAMDAFMKRMGVKSTVPAAPAPVAPAPAAPAATPFDQKKTLEKRLKDAGADAGGGGEVYAAARGGEFDTGDNVLVGEQGPEVVKFKQPGAVVPNMSYDAAPDALAAGITAAGAWNTAKGVPGRAWNATKGFVSGMRGGAAPAAAAEGVLPGGLGGAGEGAGTFGKFMKGTGYLTGALAAVGAGREAISQTEEIGRGTMAAIDTPENRWNRLKAMGEGALTFGMRGTGKPSILSENLARQQNAPDAPAGSPFGPVATASMNTTHGMQTPQQLLAGTAVPESGTGAFQRMGGGPHNYQITDPKTGKQIWVDRPGAEGPGPAVGVGAGWRNSLRGDDLDVYRIQAMREALALNASSEAGGGLRGQAMTSSAGGRKMNPGMQGLANIGVGAAASRMAQSQANTDIASATAGRRIFESDRAFAASQEQQMQGRNLATINDIATKNATPQGNLEGDAAYKNRIGTDAARLRSRVEYTLGDSGGKRLGELNSSQMGQMALANNIMNKVEAARNSGAQWARDFFGSKRFNSENLFSYMPAGATSTIIPFQGGYVIEAKNGNTMSVKHAKGGGWNLTGPDDPSDADVMALVYPLIQKYEKTRGK